MKKIYNVCNTNAEGTETYRERSRIGSINHRIWSVIAPMLLIAFGLFGVNENAWGATWTGKVSVASGSGTAKVEIYNDSDNKTETSASSTSSTEKTATYSESTSWTHWYIRDHHFIFTATPSTGYHFVKWTGDVTSTTTTYTTSKGNGGDTKTLKANFALNTYAVQFNSNGGSGTMSNQNFTYSVNQNLTANAFTKTGYTFSGWNTQDNGKGKSYSDGQSVSNLTTANGGTVTLYAQWTANTYYVAFDGNGNTSGSMSNESFTYDATAKALTSNAYSRVYTVSYNADGGTTASTTAANTTATYTFNGWEDRNSIVYNGTTYAYTTFDAPYYANTYGDLMNIFGYNKYSLIQHYVNFGKGENRSCKGDTPGLYPNKASVANMTTTAGGTVTLYANWTSDSVTLPNATKANSVIEGWYNGSVDVPANKVGVPGDSYTPTANVTLIAKWIDQYPFTMSGANYELKVGDTKENAYTFTYAENPEVHISPSGIFSYANGTITALSEGTATIYFTQASTSTIKKGESAHWTVKVSRYDNTLALNKNSATKYVGEEVTDVLKDASINSNAEVETSSSDATIAYYDVTNDKIVINNSGNTAFTSTNVTIKIWQAQNVKYTASGEKTITLTVNKYAPTISVNKSELELEQTATLTTTNTTADLNVTIEPATGVLSYANGTFTADGLGDATVTVTQPETRTISTKQEVYNFHVSKKTPTLVVKMDGTVTTSKSVTRGTVVNVAFEDNSDADVVVTNVSGARAASYINGQMTAGYVGTAVYRASLAETNTYQAKTVDFSLTVTGTPSDHVPYTNATGYTIGSRSATDWTHSYETIHFNGIPDKLTFNYAYIFQVEKIGTLSIGNPTLSYDALDDFAKTILKLGNYSDTRKGKGNTHFLYVEESADNVNWETIWTNDDASSKDTKYSGEIQLKKTTRYIRFHHSSNFSNSYTNINISELRYVEDPDPASVDFGSAIINSGEVSKKVMINWCNIAPLTVTSSNDRFYVSPSSFGNYENYGTQELTIRFSHEEEGSFSGDITISNGVDAYTKTIHVTAETTKRPQTITWNSNLVATGYAMNVGEQYPDEVITTIATATSGGNITYTSDKTDVIEVIDGVVLSAVGTGKANITAYQAGDDDFKEVYDTKEFTVTELQKQVITWNQNLYGLLTTSGNVTLNATATSGMAITYVSANENVVRVEGNTLIVVGEGETYITATQEGGKDANDVEWLSISQNNYVIVRDPNSPCNGMALSIGSLTLNSGKLIKDTTLSGIPAVLTFTAKHGTKNASTWGSAIYSALIVYQYAQIENLWDWYEVYNNVVGTGDTPSGDIILDETATKIRFKTLETGTDHTISNIRVTRPKFMKSDVSVVDQEVETNALWQQTVTISHSNIDVMNISTKKGLLTLSTSSLGDGCEDFGEDQFVVSYTPKQKDAEYLDTIVITDSKAEPTTITIPIRLHTTGWNQEIENFNLPEAALTTDALLALTATATSGLDVRYESSDEDIVRIVNGNELEIITSGTVTIKAIQDGNDRYYETSAEQTITISKAVPALVAPVGTDVTYLAALSTSSLSDGSATVTLRGVENTPVDGTFAWTNPAQQITDNVGTHSYSVTFTPDDAAYYASATTMVEIKVIAATPEATPSAANIVYGQKVKESELSNEGTEGEWTWNTGNNEAVLDAGTHEGLAVHFTPSSGNYTELDATVSLTVEKAAASLSWTTAPTELAFNATGVTYEANSISDGVISYSIVSGNDYAEINAEGVLTILVPGQTVTVQAAQAEGTNYLASEAITINVTIGAAPTTNTFTNATGNGDWDDPANWESGSLPSSDPDIFVTGDLVIDKNITVGNLTIESTGSVAVISGDTLTVNGTSEARTEYGDVHVMSDGALALGNSANLQVRDFTLDAALGNSSNAATSGQVSGHNAMNINGKAYFELTFDPSDAISFGWYDFTVPFKVNIAGGIARIKSIEDKEMVSGVDFMIMEADEQNRANGGKGWRNVNSGALQPGKLYTITFNYQAALPQNTFRFTWNGEGEIANGDTYATKYATGGDGSLNGWNGLGNGMLRHGYLAAGYKLQAYCHETNTYDLVEEAKTFAVGSAFFIQVAADGDVQWTMANATVDRPLYAPKRAVQETEEFRLSLFAEESEIVSDYLFCSASEDATEAYIIGHDLLKMGTPTDSKVARMWAKKGGKNLCDIEAALVNNKANCALGLYAPKAGSYWLAIDKAPEDATLYLTYNDAVIWDLTISPYLFDLSKGTTTGYGLRMEVKKTPAVTTDVEQTEISGQSLVRKVIIDNKVYIVTPEGKMYDIIGKSVKF